MEGVVTSVLGKRRDISEVTFPRRGAGAPERGVWRGGCGRASTGPLLPPARGLPLKPEQLHGGHPGWAGPRSLCSEAEAVFEAAERKPVVGGQDFLTPVLGSGPSPQAHQEACCPHQGALSLPPGA